MRTDPPRPCRCAAVHLAKAVAPGMCERGEGQLVFVASGAAVVSFIGYSTCAAARFTCMNASFAHLRICVFVCLSKLPRRAFLVLANPSSHDSAQVRADQVGDARAGRHAAQRALRVRRAQPKPYPPPAGAACSTQTLSPPCGCSVLNRNPIPPRPLRYLFLGPRPAARAAPCCRAVRSTAAPCRELRANSPWGGRAVEGGGVR
jgi:hypothetical protein